MHCNAEGTVKGRGGSPVGEQSVDVEDGGDVGQPEEAVQPDEPVDGGGAALRPDQHQDGGDEEEHGQPAEHCQGTGQAAPCPDTLISNVCMKQIYQV